MFRNIFHNFALLFLLICGEERRTFLLYNSFLCLTLTDAIVITKSRRDCERVNGNICLLCFSKQWIFFFANDTFLWNENWLREEGQTFTNRLIIHLAKILILEILLATVCRNASGLSFLSLEVRLLHYLGVTVLVWGSSKIFLEPSTQQWELWIVNDPGHRCCAWEGVVGKKPFLAAKLPSCHVVGIQEVSELRCSKFSAFFERELLLVVSLTVDLSHHPHRKSHIVVSPKKKRGIFMQSKCYEGPFLFYFLR